MYKRIQFIKNPYLDSFSSIETNNRKQRGRLYLLAICCFREACCGTHVLNTADLEDFCVSTVKSLSQGAKSVTAFTGPAAREARMLGQNALELVIALQAEIKANVSSEIKETLKVFEA